MEVTAVVERVRRLAALDADDTAERAVLEAGLRTVTQLEAWLAGHKARLTTRLAAVVSFPEQAVADCTRTSLREAGRLTDRATTLDRTPGLAAALSEGNVTPGHIDAVTAAAKQVDADRRDEFIEQVDKLSDVAEAATVPQFRDRLAKLRQSIERSDGMDRLERQRRATSLRTWTDHDGMWCLEGRFDPVTGVRLASRLEQAVQALFAEHTPDTCPSDPVAKQRHLQALALARLVGGDEAVAPPSGRAEFVVVVDTTNPQPDGSPTFDWGLPVEIPAAVLADLVGTADVVPVFVHDGVVLYTPGQLDLGRSTRLASRAQRRALQAFYRGCAIPGCEVPFSRCKIHHIVWWRHGGCTDLQNMLPLCAVHHHRVHDDGWQITLGPRRELTLRLPDGTIHNTGPPRRAAA